MKLRIITLVLLAMIPVVASAGRINNEADCTARGGQPGQYQAFWSSHRLPTAYVNRDSLQIYSVNLRSKHLNYCELPSRTGDSDMTYNQGFGEQTQTVHVTYIYNEPNPSRAGDDNQQQTLEFELPQADFTAEQIGAIRESNRNLIVGPNTQRRRAAVYAWFALEVQEQQVVRDQTDYSRPEYCTWQTRNECSSDDNVYYPHRVQRPGTDFILNLTHQ